MVPAKRLHVDFFFGRERELKLLQSSLKQIVEEQQSHFATITGPSGCGKSELVKRFQEIIGDKALFCSGKCEQTQSNEPYSVLKQAFHQLCVTVHSDPTNESQLDLRQAILKDVGDTLGREGTVISEVIPELKGVVGCMESGCKDSDENISNAQERMSYLFRVLVKAIAKNVPLVMFCDDLQWVDASSMNVIRWLAVDHKIKGFLLIGSFRDNEVSADHFVAKELQLIAQKKTRPKETIQSLHLHNLSLPEVNSLLSEVMNLDSEETEPLSCVVHEKTLGNLFFVLQYLRVLQTKKLLTFSWIKSKWTWEDTERIYNHTNIADNVVDLVAERLKETSNHVQICLMVASGLSSTFSRPLLVATVAGLAFNMNSLDVEEALEIAVDEGFLLRERGGGQAPDTFKFAHDRIQQAAYSLIQSDSQRDEMHHKIGCVLLAVRENLPRESERISFLAPNQLQLGRACLKTEMDFICLATLHLHAGRKAMALGAFVQAAQSFKHGIELMSCVEAGWSKYHDLQLTLYQSLADTSWRAGTLAASEDIVKELVVHAKSNEEKFRVHLTVAKAFRTQARHQEAVILEIEQLRALGVMPKHFQTLTGITMLASLTRQLKSMSLNEIKELPTCSDPKIDWAFEFLHELVASCTFSGNNSMQVLAICTMVRLVLRHGIHKKAVACFALLGIFVTNFGGDAKEGRRLGQMTEALIVVTGESDMMALLCIWGCLGPWYQPIVESLEPLFDAYMSGMKNGAVVYALDCFTVFLMNGLYAGMSLSTLIDDGQDHLKTLMAYSQKSLMVPLQAILQAMLNLACPIDNPTEMSGIAMNEQEFWKTGHNDFARFHFYRHKMLVCYYYEKYDEAYRMFRLAKKHGKTNILFVEVADMMYFQALIPLALAAKTTSLHHKRRARNAINAIRKCIRKEHKGMNLSHKLLLLDAGSFALSGKKGNEHIVKDAYERAIKTASRTGYRQDAALANLHAGLYFLRKRQDIDWARYYTSRSIKLFDDWGAHGVAKHLISSYEQSVDLSRHQTINSTNHLGRKRLIVKDVITSIESPPLDQFS